MELLVAAPPESVTGAPKFAPSTWNWTVPPDAVPPASALTVAVNVTAWPKTDGFTLEATVVVVFPTVTPPESL